MPLRLRRKLALSSFNLLLLAIFPASIGTVVAQTQPSTATFKVKIEASDADRQLLLGKLKTNGAAGGVTFSLVDQGFDYRVVFSTTHAPLDATQRQVNSSGATAKVFDAHGAELFDVQRAARFTNSGAANAIAKDIVSRLMKLKSPQGS